MKNRRAYILLFAAVTFAGVSQAMGQGYIGSVLYPLPVPNGATTIRGFGVSASQTVGQTYYPTGGPDHALLWTTAGVIDLHPTNLGMDRSVAYGTSGSQQVGAGEGSGTDTNYHALLWTGSAASVVDLNPTALPGIDESFALATNGAQQVGYGDDGVPGYADALLWEGTAASAVDLSPTKLGGITVSEALATDGTQQVGWGSGPEGYKPYALLWSGTAASVINLNPTDLSGITNSEAVGISGNQEVGFGESAAVDALPQAMLWNGTASGAVDLNPSNLSGIEGSEAFGTNGTQQVGYAETASNDIAVLWGGTAESAVDLNALLSSTGTWANSAALTIDSSGNAYGWAEGTFNNQTGYFAVEWSAVPEPATGSLLLIVGTGTLIRRRPKQFP